MRLLITGGAGFIGSNFARYWSTHRPDDRIVVLDALTYAGNRDNLADLEASGRIAFVHADIADQAAVEETITTHALDTIVNFAAESHNSLAVLDPTRFFRTNVMGTVALCEAARRLEVARLHHISTCEVYGDLALDSEEAFTEDSPYRPRTPYNASKAAADHVVRSYGETFGLQATITNCCNNYGPYQFPEKVVPLFATRALKGEPLPLYASTKNRREWLHVDDHCSAIEAVLDRGRIGETYLVGSGQEESIEELADIILEATGQPESLKRIVPDRPGHDRRYLLDSTKIKTELGWEPKVSFADGIAATIAWYRDNEAWWEPLLRRAPVVEDSWGQPPPPTDAGTAAPASAPAPASVPAPAPAAATASAADPAPGD
ncbi:MAG TPA: dTDP-glucose 4,6-dehydratase [Acidimicrobiales bacterium]|nr:dTDP-glucose 4,6-dehydratase [Acidimicrobiales bacterium]